MNLHKVKYGDVEQITSIFSRRVFKQEFCGSSPAPFIGRFGYPYVNIGVLSPQINGDTSYYDAPRRWNSDGITAASIAELRSNLVNSRLRWNIKNLKGKFFDIFQEAGIASKPVELEISLKERPAIKNESDIGIIPFGPQGEVNKARITSNSVIDARIERVARDTDLKAEDAILSLYRKGFEENSLSKLLSVGSIGLLKNRKLVPTRWGITAVDDAIGKNLINNIKNLPVGEHQFYLNRRTNPWSVKGYAYSTDFEDYTGRTVYAEECAGGYYACRLPVLEKMKVLKRQQAVLALRFIAPEYATPLGVWVCREATRRSLQQKPLSFASQELLLQYAREFIKRKFNFELELLLHKSKLLKKKKEQKKLSEF